MLEGSIIMTAKTTQTNESSMAARNGGGISKAEECPLSFQVKPSLPHHVDRKPTSQIRSMANSHVDGHVHIPCRCGW
jgi:hypothetical protein